MAELPDITIYVEALQARVVGQRLERVRLASPFVLRSVDPPIAEAHGRQVCGVGYGPLPGGSRWVSPLPFCQHSRGATGRISGVAERTTPVVQLPLGRRKRTMAAQVARRMFTTDEFQRMAQAGILSEDDRVELIEGEIIRMSPIGSRHAASVDRLTARLVRRLAQRAIVRVQSPILLSNRSEPQPDVSVLKARADFYAAKHPGPADVLLVIEVIDSSSTYDRTLKLPAYARGGIAEVWLIDLVGDAIDVYRRPALRGYREQQTRTRGQRLAAAAFPRLAFAVSELLG